MNEEGSSGGASLCEGFHEEGLGEGCKIRIQKCYTKKSNQKVSSMVMCDLLLTNLST